MIPNETEEIIVDPLVTDQIAPATNIEPDLSLFDVVEDTTSQESIQEQLEQLRKENETLRQSSSLTDGMTQGFQTLAQQLAAQQTPVQPDFSKLPGLPQAPVNNMPQTFNLPNKEELNTKFFENPYDGMMQMLAPALQNQQSAITSQMTEMNKMISKNNAYMSDANKPILSKYGDEVAMYASRLQSSDPWGDAIKQATANHYVEMQQEAINAATEKAIADYKAKQEADLLAAAKVPLSPVGGTTLGAGQPGAVKKTRITAAQLARVKAETVKAFGGDAGPDLEKRMFELMKSNGTL